VVFYPSSSMTGEQCAVLAAPASRDWPEKHPRRRVLDAIFYLVRGGIVWRALPGDLAAHLGCAARSDWRVRQLLQWPVRRAASPRARARLSPGSQRAHDWPFDNAARGRST
jgi:hypothetical protein